MISSPTNPISGSYSMSPLDAVHKTETPGLYLGTAGDFGRAFVHSSIEDPINGAAELFGTQVHCEWAEKFNANSLLAKAGELGGTVADFVLLSKGADLALTATGKLALTDSVMGSTVKMGGIGAFYGGILTPNATAGDRLKSAFSDGVTFGAMGGAAKYMEPLTLKSLSTEISIGSKSGAIGGLANSAATSLWNWRVDSPQDIVANTFKYAAFGAAFGLAGKAIDNIAGKTRARAVETEAPPIPLRPEGAGTALSYHQMPVDMAHPLAHEPLVKASDVGLSSDSYYYIADGSNGPYNRQIPGSLPDVWIRQSVAEKLQQVNARLAPRDLEVHVYDAYRPIETQQSLWDHFIEKGRQQLKTDDPATLREFAGHYVSEPHGFDPANPETWPTHNTGAAIDLTLRQKSTGKILDMGSGFDEASPSSFTDALEKNGSQTDLAVARQNRRILHNAMTQEGFANYPYEWWHYDYGTQLWLQNSNLLNTGAKAWYGPGQLPA